MKKIWYGLSLFFMVGLATGLSFELKASETRIEEKKETPQYITPPLSQCLSAGLSSAIMFGIISKTIGFIFRAKTDHLIAKCLLAGAFAVPVTRFSPSLEKRFGKEATQISIACTSLLLDYMLMKCV